MRRPFSGWYSTSVSTIGRSILNGLVCLKINWRARNTMICICIGGLSLSTHHHFSRKHTCSLQLARGDFRFLFLVRLTFVTIDIRYDKLADIVSICISFSHLNNSNCIFLTMVEFKAALKEKIDTCPNSFFASFFYFFSQDNYWNSVYIMTQKEKKTSCKYTFWC
jgi:hypothetical protein